MTLARTYLDYNASAPLRPEARAAMLAALDFTGNPSSVHAEGRQARAIIETAREQVAALVNAKPSEVVFTSGATEANAWALAQGWDTIFLSGLEHDSVLAPARVSGAKLADLPAKPDGTVAVEALAEHVLLTSVNFGRALVTLQMANNETGVIQPVAETAAFAHGHDLLVHTDAVQAAGRVPVDFKALDVDMLSMSSHKIGGPKGAGALVIRDGLNLRPLIAGGGQERRRRAGTENVAAIAGFGAAAKSARSDHASAARIEKLRGSLEANLVRASPDAVIFGSAVHRLINTTCVAVPGKAAETLVIKFDLKGVAVSAGSACSSGKVGSGHVLAAMGVPANLARSAIRISLGPETRDDDIAAFLAVWKEIAGAGALAA